MFRPCAIAINNLMDRKLTHNTNYNQFKKGIHHTNNVFWRSLGIGIKVFGICILGNHGMYYFRFAETGWNINTPEILGDGPQTSRHPTTPPTMPPHVYCHEQYEEYTKWIKRFLVSTDDLLMLVTFKWNDDMQRESQTPIMEALFENDTSKIEDEQKFHMARLMQEKAIDIEPEKIRESLVRDNYRYYFSQVKENVTPRYD